MTKNCGGAIRKTVMAVIAVIAGSFPVSATEVKFNDIIKEIAIKGDLRLRHESFYRSDQDGAPAISSNKQRHRQRFRLRLGVDFKLPSNVEAKFQFASGTGEQV